MSNKILFFGNERLATGVTTTAPTLGGLIDAGYKIAAVVVAQGEQGPSRKPRKLEVVELANKHKIPVLAPTRLSEIRGRLKEFKADAGVAVAYGKLIPGGIIDLFPAGILNIHPSLLPLHRGATPIESAILNGDKETGVSLMRLTTDLDSGPVYAQSKLMLGKQSKQEIADSLLAEGVKWLLKLLPAIIDGSAASPAPQYESLATFDKRISKQDGVIDCLQSAVQLEREIRAYAGWPRSRTVLGDKGVAITKVKVLDDIGTPGSIKAEKGRLVIFCKWGALEIESLIPAGKKEMSAEAFLAGYKLN